MESGVIEIVCPICKNKIGTRNLRSKMNKIVHCKSCKKRIVYNAENGDIEVKPIPPRNCSSGLTFY